MNETHHSAQHEASAVDSTAPDSSPAPRFPIVAVGASAGGLAAFISFFETMVPDSGMAFILIQHLPPEHESRLAEILAKATAMPVLQVEDGIEVLPNHVYVICPGHTMTIGDGRLHLGEPVEKRGHRKPVDDFFRSLADESQEHAIGIILSGMGDNGTAGAQAIKAVGGLCIAQDPESAQFTSMPRSLIDAGYADQVLLPAEMPDVLLKYIHHPYLDDDLAKRAEAASILRRERLGFNEIIALLKARGGHDFSGYKKPTLLRRIQRRMGVNQITEFSEYVAVLRRKSDEVVSLTNDLMINVTGFFRDPQAWEMLRSLYVAPMIDQRENGSTIRAWVTACASGEEAYTLSMLLAEEAERAGKKFEVKVFASDTSPKSLSFARAGLYPGGIEGDLSLERIDRFFDRDDQSYRIKREVRETIVFAPQNLLSDPPFSRLDIACCRNLLIYLEPEVQQKALAVMHFSLRPGGCLFLGNSETPGSTDELFEPLNKKWRVYRRTGTARHIPQTALQPGAAAATGEKASVSALRPSVAQLTQRALLDQFGPPSVVIDRTMKVIFFHGATDRFLTQRAGEPTRDLLELAKMEFRSAIRSAVRKSFAEKQKVFVLDGRLKSPQGSHRVRITAAPLAQPWMPDHFLVTFEELDEETSQPIIPPPAKDSSAAAENQANAEDSIEEELRAVREELQNTIEDLESSNEELKASNEEVTSTNEELQSANEELETSKEELQSLNEELITVNAQLQAKIEELEGKTNDLKNLLGSTNIAVIFLDTLFRIRSFTPAVTNLLELIPSDIGRPLANLAQKFSDAKLLDDARVVLEKLIPLEAEILSNTGNWYLRQALPYRTADNRIDGVVITFVDITRRKQAEMSIKAAQLRLQAVLNQMPAGVAIAEAATGRIILANEQVTRMFRFPSAEGESVAAPRLFKGFHPDGSPYLPEEWPFARALATGETISDEEIDFLRGDGTRGTLLASASPVRDALGNVTVSIAAFWDISERKQHSQNQREEQERFKVLVEAATDYAIFMIDRSGRIATWNNGAERILGYTEANVLGKPVTMLFTPEDQAKGMAERELARAAASGRSEDDRWHVRADGTRFFASGIVTPVRDEQGEVKSYVKILRDFTEQKHQQELVDEALRTADLARSTAETANHAKDDFIATISHELRTPLTAILLWSRMLRNDALSDEDRSEGIDTIERSAMAQQQLIEDLLDVSRMVAGKLRLSSRETRLTTSIESAVDAIRPTAEARGVSLEIDSAEDVGVVLVDPDRLQQVIWNLLSNAVKFTPSGGKVSVNLHRDGAWMEIRVSDTGMGIDAEFVPHVFDRFRQANAGATRKYGGLGLGLAIAKQLVELHGGTISVESAGKDRGATFMVRIPYRAALSNEVNVQSKKSTRTAELAGMRILLVDDDTQTRRALAMLLRRHGAEVIGAESVVQAIQAYTEQAPAIVVSDIAMPGADGYELIRQIRQIEGERGAPRVPALALTAFARDEDRRHATEAGFDAHVPKPIDADSLKSVLLRYVR